MNYNYYIICANVQTHSTWQWQQHFSVCKLGVIIIIFACRLIITSRNVPSIQCLVTAKTGISASEAEVGENAWPGCPDCQGIIKCFNYSWSLAFSSLSPPSDRLCVRGSATLLPGYCSVKYAMLYSNYPGITCLTMSPVPANHRQERGITASQESERDRAEGPS